MNYPKSIISDLAYYIFTADIQVTTIATFANDTALPAIDENTHKIILIVYRISRPPGIIKHLN